MLALARRYRPKRFADLLVQDHVAAVLRGAVARGRVGHGYLLTGPRGVGKTTAARILAMALNCPNRDPSGDPCGECESCLRIWNGGASLDVVEIDAASNRGVDDARELRERAMYAASQAGHHKVYIVDEAHMLTREAWNALLKILEEPPPGVVFVFATTEPQKIAATAAPVLSRLQRFDFRRIGPAAIRERLRQVLDTEDIAADDDALTLIARHADGGMRDALSVLDQCLSFGEGTVNAARVREVLGLVEDELYAEALALVADHRPEGVFPLVDRLVSAGADLTEFMAGTGEVLRALLMLQLGTEPEGLTEAVRQGLGRYRDRLQPGDVVRMLRLLTDSEASIRRSANPRLVTETLLLRWAMMDRTLDLREVLQGSEAGVRSSAPRGSSGPPPSSPPSGDSRPQPEARQAQPEPRQTPPETRILRDVAPSAGAAAAPRGSATVPDAWPQVLAEVRARSRFLGEAVANTTPGPVEGSTLPLVLAESNPLFAERIQAQATVVEEVVRRHTGQALRIRVTVVEGEPGAAAKPRPLTESSLRADRLRSFRAKDPALDTAADALDLEIVD
ncbi:MAG TPA: DNA polymerase III subunit gamma/tau [Gemmatimonadales bacterium]|nr:DNA polymerase III subunit gamma/tau [Gemmatimonadales bacterium]